MSLYVFLKFLGHAALPPASMLVAIVLGALLALAGFRRLGRVFAVLGVAQTLVFSMAPVAEPLMAPLQNEARAAADPAPKCCFDAIVVLGGSIVPASPPRYPNPGLVGSSDRLWQAARLYGQGRAPRVIVSGGTFTLAGVQTRSESQTMRLFLRDLGVPDEAIIEEDQAVNTLQNIAFLRRIVGDKPVALVTSAYHMPRSLRIARRAGLNVAAFPDEYRYAMGDGPWDEYMPSLNAVAISSLALWEYLALAFDGRKIPGSP